MFKLVTMALFLLLVYGIRGCHAGAEECTSDG